MIKGPAGTTVKLKVRGRKNLNLQNHKKILKSIQYIMKS